MSNSSVLKLGLAVIFLIGCTTPENPGYISQHYSVVVQNLKKDSFSVYLNDTFFRRAVTHMVIGSTSASYFEHRPDSAAVIVIAKVAGWTTPLSRYSGAGMEKDTAFNSKVPSLPRYNSAVDLIIVESLKGQHKLGDTIAYLQFGGMLGDKARAENHGMDILHQGCRMGAFDDLKRLVYLRKFGSRDGDADLRTDVRRVRFPTYIPTSAHFIVTGDSITVGTCPLRQISGHTMLLSELRSRIADTAH